MSRINRGREALKGKREVVEKERENAQKDLDAAEVHHKPSSETLNPKLSTQT